MKTKPIRWQKIIKEWRKALYDFEDRTGDTPVWYAERAHVGMLSLGIRAAGYCVLEEFPWQKTLGQAGASERERYTGRVDLWFGDRWADIWVDAKASWHSPMAKLSVAKRLGAIEKRVRCEGRHVGRGKGWIAIFVRFYAPDGWYKTAGYAKSVAEFRRLAGAVRPRWSVRGLHFVRQPLADRPDGDDRSHTVGVGLFLAPRSQ